MMFARLFVSILLAALGCSAAVVQDEAQCLPLVQDGSGWTTVVTVVNLEAKPSRFELTFRPAKGLPTEWTIGLRAPCAEVEGHIVRGSLPVGGSIAIETTGTSKDIQRGYAQLFGFQSARLGLRAIVRKEGGSTLVVDGAAEREDAIRLPFDNSGGSSTSLVWVSETDYALVNMIVFAADGKELLRDQFQFSVAGPVSQEMFHLEERYPQLRGVRGVVDLEVTYPNAGFYDRMLFSAIAIQTEPTGLAFVQESLTTQRWKPMRY